MTWEEYDYQLALLYALWRSMPAPPPAKDKERRLIWERMMENAVRIPARELLQFRPKGKRENPFPKDPTDILSDPAEMMWKNFIDHLNRTQPLRAGDGTHKNFLGSIKKYEIVFMDANR